MPRFSNSHTVRVVAPGSSALATFAATLTSGQWSSFTTGSLSSTIFSCTSYGSEPTNINGYGNRMMWDPIHKKIVYAGTTHTNTGVSALAGAGRMAMWDDSTNTWSSQLYDTWSAGNPGHSYYHLALNRINGDFYFRRYGGTQIFRRVYNGDVNEAQWNQSFSNISTGGQWANQVAGGLEWFPELNSGSGGLVFANHLGAAYSNAALSTWTWASAAESGQIHNWIAYNNGFVYFGGGSNALVSGGGLRMWRMSPTGTITRMADTPLEGSGSPGGASVFAHPNGLDLLMFQSVTSGTNTIYKWTASTNTWATIGTHQLGTPSGNQSDFYAGAVIPEYSVILFIRNQNYSSPSCLVYKP
jgi:hypothetical protein